MICVLREGNKVVYGSPWPDGGEPDHLCWAAPSHPSILQAKSQAGKVWAEQRLGLQGPLIWFQQKDFEELAPGTNDPDASSLTGCAFSSFMRPSPTFRPSPAPIMVRMGGSGACEAAHHCCCCSSFLEILEGSVRNGLFRPQGKLRHVLIKSYANTFQNIMQEKILPFLPVRLQGLWKLHLSFVISSL